MEQQTAQIQLQMGALASQVQALTTVQTQQQVNAQLQLEKEQLEQRLNVVLGQLQRSLQNGGAAGAVPQPSAGSSAGTSKPVSHIDVLKSVKQPQSLKDREQWERFTFQVETYLALINEEFPTDLEEARKSTTFVDPIDMTDDCKARGRQLFAMLTSWTQELAVAVKIARGIREQNGFEFWRLLYRELAPDSHSKSLIWRRSLLSPKFPSKETEFSAALQEWEADLDRYEAEYGAQKAISDEDKRAVVLTEAPNALKQHLSMHIAALITYQAVREVVVSYLQAKQVWKPSAAYAGSTARSDPMEIGLVQHKGKGKDKGGKGKDGKKGKGKDQKGKGKDTHSKDKGGKGQDSKDRCAICWKAGHTTEKCWFNTKGQEKGKGKKAVAAVNEGDNASIVSAGPSASQVGGNNSVITLPSSSSTSYRKDKNVSKIGEHRLLMVKPGHSGQHRVESVSPQAILATQTAGSTVVSQHQQNAILAEQAILAKWQAISDCKDKPGWHDLDTDTKVYVVRGKAGTQRKYVTPGPQYSDFTLRSTWQWDYAADAWETRELGRKWKLLQKQSMGIACFPEKHAQDSQGSEQRHAIGGHWSMLFGLHP